MNGPGFGRPSVEAASVGLPVTSETNICDITSLACLGFSSLSERQNTDPEI